MNGLARIIHDLTSSQLDKLMEIMDDNGWNVTTALLNRRHEILAN